MKPQRAYKVEKKTGGGCQPQNPRRRGIRPKLLEHPPPTLNSGALLAAAEMQEPGASRNVYETFCKSDAPVKNLVAHLEQMEPPSPDERSLLKAFRREALAEQAKERAENPGESLFSLNKPPTTTTTITNRASTSGPFLSARLCSFTPLALPHTTAVVATFLAQVVEDSHDFLSPPLFDNAGVPIPGTPPAQIRKGPAAICSFCGFAPELDILGPPSLRRAASVCLVDSDGLEQDISPGSSVDAVGMGEEEEEEDNGPGLIRCSKIGCGFWRCGKCAEEREDVECGEGEYYWGWLEELFGISEDEEMGEEEELGDEEMEGEDLEDEEFIGGQGEVE